jgi:Endonuclease/Exonuclease/phosphatase family
MKIATFNINNIRRRPNLLDWFREANPDVVCLQELKATDAEFPAKAIKDAGYEVIWRGQKTWNGVAILSKSRPIETLSKLAGDRTDTQSRYIEAAVNGIIVASLYAPKSMGSRTHSCSPNLKTSQNQWIRVSPGRVPQRVTGLSRQHVWLGRGPGEELHSRSCAFSRNASAESVALQETCWDAAPRLGSETFKSTACPPGRGFHHEARDHPRRAALHLSGAVEGADLCRDAMREYNLRVGLPKWLRGRSNARPSSFWTR